ncbi:DctP family TRAP transporter solute-binding subunit [Peribacillus sp. TH16]|uniref:DctP family TRAP transporter solute-binding subunit n=1 Tax=Peribacillus TaxID=2675229 RepID=UPI00191305C8|nr:MULTISPECIES: DctP family TRAP transporter solute-binding subunit [unclassified Peribacillus]MBK5461629.1 DctP family TRAP transporter solute-binding subunit [Peribacillus sp. TH27]MBK5485051.1 DctP family TRAP transporter solute-binding subunit [Peribacillus sp. TH16]
MRAFWGYFVLIGIGLLIAVYISFQSFFSSSNFDLPKDEEQVGMEDQIVIKFSHVVAENTPKGLAANRFADLVDEYTDHRVKIEVYPNQSLYSDHEEINALHENKVQMIAPTTSKITSISKKWMLLDLPYVFPTDAALQEALNGEVGDELLDQLNTIDIEGLAFWSNNFKQITSNKPIRHPEDFVGKNFRIMPSTVIESQFQHFGATTSKLEFNDTFKSLEINKTDSQENTISNIYSKKLYEVQKYLTISNHGYLGYVVMMNKPFWDKLPVDIQQQIQRAMDDTTNWLWIKSNEMNQAQLREIEKKSNIDIYTLSDEEKKEWMDKMTVIYPEFESTIGTKLMEKMERIREKHLEK